MVDRSKAIFVSYASDDEQAAQRLHAGLSAAGFETWFDRNELHGGDAWDARIRQQIRDCTLFAPIISANTEARSEGSSGWNGVWPWTARCRWRKIRRSCCRS